MLAITRPRRSACACGRARATSPAARPSALKLRPEPSPENPIEDLDANPLEEESESESTRDYSDSDLTDSRAPSGRISAPGKPGAAEEANARSEGFDDAEQAAKARELMALREPGQCLAGLSDFAKEYGDEAFCRRLLRKYDGNVRRCTQRYIEALRWRESHREILTTRDFKLAGDYRVIGADRERRPIAYLCMRNQILSNSEGLDQSLICMLQAVDNMPPGVEKSIHVWDLHGMRVRLNLNPAPVGQMLQSQEGYFAERMQELIIIEMPTLAGFIKDAIWPLVPEKTRRKVRFLTPAQAQEYFQRACEEPVASRICSIMEQNRDPRSTMEERKATWRWVDEDGDLMPLAITEVSV